MERLNNQIEDHYHKSNLYEEIILRLQQKGVDLNQLTRDDISAVDEFHVRGAEVSRELAQYLNLQGSRILDVGCGLGGPCRMLADEYDCEVTGIDLSPEYIRTAEKLSSLVSLSDKTKFTIGNATALPFNSHSFDAVWTQHVQMNIPDKMKFYSEITRVLIPGGHLIYYDILKASTKSVNYPVPWAQHADLSFLIDQDEIHGILMDLQMTKIYSKDQTQAGIDFFDSMLSHIRENGPPKLGLNVLMGEAALLKITNLLNGLKENCIVLDSGVYQKTIK